jgi:hypothetical protein
LRDHREISPESSRVKASKNALDEPYVNVHCISQCEGLRVRTMTSGESRRRRALAENWVLPGRRFG